MNVYPFIEAEKQEAGSVLRACWLVEVSRSALMPTVPARPAGRSTTLP